MIYKHMYCGYKNSGKLTFTEDERIITASAANFEDMTFLYFESKDATLTADDVVSGDLKQYPNGENWFEMNEIFHYFTPEDDSEWERKIKDKKAWFRINQLNRDKVASYIYYHFDHQNTNQFDVDKFFSIYIFGDYIVMYGETPTENVTWEEIKGRRYEPENPLWDQIMNEHFKAWPDNEKKWVKIENE